MSIFVRLPIKLVSEANAHEHWRKRAKRAKAQRTATKLYLAAHHKPMTPPLVITITRVAPRRIDDDNNVGSAKHVRDGIADYLGIDDRDSRVEWKYAQKKPDKPRTYAVEIEIVEVR